MEGIRSYIEENTDIEIVFVESGYANLLISDAEISRIFSEYSDIDLPAFSMPEHTDIQYSLFLDFVTTPIVYGFSPDFVFSLRAHPVTAQTPSVAYDTKILAEGIPYIGIDNRKAGEELAANMAARLLNRGKVGTDFVFSLRAHPVTAQTPSIIAAANPTALLETPRSADTDIFFFCIDQLIRTCCQPGFVHIDSGTDGF